MLLSVAHDPTKHILVSAISQRPCLPVLRQQFPLAESKRQFFLTNIRNSLHYVPGQTPGSLTASTRLLPYAYVASGAAETEALYMLEAQCDRDDAAESTLGHGLRER
jgi:hypothetical protein